MSIFLLRHANSAVSIQYDAMSMAVRPQNALSPSDLRHKNKIKAGICLLLGDTATPSVCIVDDVGG